MAALTPSTCPVIKQSLIEVICMQRSFVKNTSQTGPIPDNSSICYLSSLLTLASLEEYYLRISLDSATGFNFRQHI